MSYVYNVVIHNFVFKWMLRVKHVNVEKNLEPHSEDSMIFVLGNHPPLLLMTEFFYIVVTDICGELVIIVKEIKRLEDVFILFMVVALWVMDSCLTVARGSGTNLEKTLEGLTKRISKYIGKRRALVLFPDTSRPNKRKIFGGRKFYTFWKKDIGDREKMSRMLKKVYGVNDSLNWLSTMYPRVHGFAAIVETLPSTAQVRFLFMVPDQRIWSALELHKLPGLTIRYWFEEESVQTFKQRDDESREEWLRRLTFVLADHWRWLNMRQDKYINH
jgi:hypothetical protein